MVTRYDDSPNIYTVPVARYDLQTSVHESKYEEIHQNAVFCPVEYIQKEEPNKISEKKTIWLYIVPGAPTLFYQKGNQNSYIISSLASALHYMGNEYSSKYIIKRKQKSLYGILNKGKMHFCRHILMRHHQKKRKNTQLSYLGMAYTHAIWYIAESVYLSNYVFVTIHVAPDWLLYYSLR